MSDVQQVREVLRKIDDLKTKVREANHTLRILKEPTVVLKATHMSQNKELSKDLMPSIIDAVDSQIQMWEIEIEKLEDRVSLK